MRSSSTVAALHKPIAAVLYRNCAKKLQEWNIDGYVSNKLVKNTIVSAISRRQMVLRWDDHAKWEFTGSMYTKLRTVLGKKNLKSAPYSDAKPS